MPSLPIAPNCLKIRVIGTTQNRPVVHVMHATFTGGPVATADCTAIAIAFRSAWNTNIAPVLNLQTTYNTFEVTDLSSNTGAVGVSNVASTGSAGAASGFPASLCAVLSWKTSFHFRGGHSRTYLPWRVSADMINGNQLGGTYVTALQTAGATFLTAVNAITSGTITIALAMVSYHTHNTLRPQGTPFPITGVAVHNRCDSQRRRLGKEF